MDIIFVNPPLTLKERFGKFAPAGNIMPPLGLCYLAAACREKGLEVEIIDAPAEELDVTEVKERVLNKKPRFVGVTATTLSILSASKVADAIKQGDASIITVIGGPHLSAVPEKTLKRYQNFDFGVIGEGELTIIDLIDSIKSDNDVKDVNGIIYRNGSDLYRTAKRETIEKLDDLPIPAWDLLPNYPYLYKPLKIAMSDRLQGSIITSRGCPYSCSYCPKDVFGKRVRNHSVNRVMEMILEQYHRYGVRDLEIYDDILVLSQDRIREICNCLITEKLDLVWSCNSTIGSVNRETLGLMKKAGCWKIAFGIESGDSRILKLMNKNLDLDKAKTVLKMSKKAGFINRGYFIIGFPAETEESIERTINFAKDTDLDIVQFNSFTPLPGSPVYETVNQYGQFDDNWNNMNFVNSVFIPHGFSKETLEQFIKRAYKSVYLQPKMFVSFLKQVKNISTFFKLLRNFMIFLRIIYLKDKFIREDDKK